MQTPWDCIVVGGGAAGLSAALVLGRARQRTLVVDAGSQSNRVAHGIGGLLGNDGRAPSAFYAAGRNELAAYPTVELRFGEVVRGERHGAGFAFELADGAREHVTLLANGPAELAAEDLERLRAATIAVDERRVAEPRGDDDTLTAVAFADGGERPCAGLLVPVTLHQRSPLAEQLGAAAADPGPIVADALEVDEAFHTNVPGLFAAGDVSLQMPSVANAVAAGSSAAAMVVHGLVAEAHGLTDP